MNWRFSSLLPVDLQSYLIAAPNRPTDETLEGSGSGSRPRVGLGAAAAAAGARAGAGAGAEVSRLDGVRFGVPFSSSSYQPTGHHASG